MFRILLIFFLALLPPLLGFWIIEEAKRRFNSRMRQIRTRSTPNRAITSESFLDTLETEPYIGEISCRYNARSPHLRCAINPSGPCENCLYYEPKGMRNGV